MPLTQITTSNIDTTNSLFFRNRIINGAMQIDQRNAGASVAASNGYTLDRWFTGSISGATLAAQQVSEAPPGFTKSYKYTVSVSSTTSDYNWIGQLIEGNNVSDLDWGLSTGSTVTLSFWIKSSIAGTYNGYIRYLGSTATHYYLPTYTINSANTWEYKTIVIPAPPTAAGPFTSGLTAAYMTVAPYAMYTSGYSSTTAGNTWTNGSSSTIFKATGTNVNFPSTSGATVQFTGVQLEKGTSATAFEYRPYAIELVLCQRYFEKTYSMNTVPGTATESNVDWYGTHAQSLASTGVFQAQARPFKVLKRVAPTMAFWDMAGNSGKWTRYLVGGGPNQNNAITVDTQDDSGFRFFVAAGSSTSNVGGHWTASAEL